MDPPYRPRHKGFDEEATRRAQATAELARSLASSGEPAGGAYVDEGPDEAARRTGRSREELGDAIERARRRR